MDKTEFREMYTLSEHDTCIRVNDKHDVLITRTDEGVVVDIFLLPYNTETEQADESDSSCYSFDREITE